MENWGGPLSIRWKIRLWCYHLCLLVLSFFRSFVRLFVVFTVSPTWTLESNNLCSGQLIRTLCHYGTNTVLCKGFVITNNNRAKVRNCEVGTNVATSTTGSENDIGLWQGRTNPERQVAPSTKFCLVASSIRKFSVWVLLRVALMVFEILGWFLDFWKISASLAYGNILEEYRVNNTSS